MLNVEQESSKYCVDSTKNLTQASRLEKLWFYFRTFMIHTKKNDDIQATQKDRNVILVISRSFKNINL